MMLYGYDIIVNDRLKSNKKNWVRISQSLRVKFLAISKTLYGWSLTIVVKGEREHLRKQNIVK